MARSFAALVPLVFCAAYAPNARGDEPVAAGEPRLMSETSEVTTVVDAFDKDDPFDLNLTLGFQQSFKHSDIRRESALFQPGLTTGGFTAATENVAKYSQSTSTLNMGADIGLWKDLALIFRLPLILSDSRSLSDLDGSTKNPQRLQDPTGQQLFSVPFNSPNRSGIDYFAVGLNYAIYNQQRDRTKPTWVFGVEGQFAVGPRLHACNADAAIKCPDPSNPSIDRSPGISRGMDALVIHTTFARRFGYVEPYTGLLAKVEFPESNSDFGETNGVRGSIVNHPPVVGTITMGVEVIPWERREQFQRFVADFRVRASYYSPGREYTELFDALGSSQAASLRTPNPGGYTSTDGVTSVVNKALAPVPFTGITDQDGYGSFNAGASATWQAGEYVKFTAGLGFTYNQSHLLTTAEPCNPNFSSDQNAVAESGPCRAVVNGGKGPQPVTGIPNPNYHAVIDTPGRRFAADDTTIFDLFVSGVVMF